MLKNILIGLFALFSLCACDERSNIEQMTPPEALNFTNHFYDTVRKGDMIGLMQMVTYGEADAERRRNLQKMINSFPKTTPESVEVLGVNWKKSTSKPDTISLVIEYRLDKPSILTQTVLVKAEDGTYLVQNAHFNVIPASWAETNAWKWGPKPLASYAVLVANIMVLAFMAWSFIACLRMPNLTRKAKWIWCFVTLIGCMSLSVNWTTNVLAFNILSIQILPLGFGREGYSGPFSFGTTLPIGAIIFWMQRFGAGSGNRTAKPDE